jgi:hypothetical protein
MIALKHFVRRISHYIRIKNSVWILKDLFYRLRRKILKKRMNQIIKDNETSVSYDNSLFVLNFGSRLIGNRDNVLEKVFDSFLQTTANPKMFEFRIKIDYDDDLVYFENLKIKYTGIQMAFNYTPRGNGYADMHIWHNELLNLQSNNVKYHIIITDDALFSMLNWDLDLVSRIEEKELETHYWIGMPNKLEEAVKLLGPNPIFPEPVYWIAGTDFPVLSVNLVNLISEVVNKSENRHWNAFGNLFNIDSYFGDLLRNMELKAAKICHLEIGNYFKRVGITSWNSYIWPGESKKGKLRTTTLSTFFNNDSQDVRNRISSHIEQKIFSERL